MAIVSHEEAERYSSGGKGEWFQLKNDGDTARVQFVYSTYDDVTRIVAHKVKVGDKERYVDCLRPRYDSPIDMCPFCAAGISARPVTFILMYQHDDGKVKIWERGRQFLTKLQGLFNRYSPLCDYVFDIERHGKAGDQKTTYDVYPLDKVDPVDISDVELPEILGGLVLSKSVDEMEVYLNTDRFPEEDSDTTPSRRVNKKENAETETESIRPRSSRAGSTSAPTPQTSESGNSRASRGNREVF
jgi:hypothetical protein